MKLDGTVDTKRYQVGEDEDGDGQPPIYCRSCGRRICWYVEFSGSHIPFLESHIINCEGARDPWINPQ